MKNTYTNADQTVLNIALPILKDYKAQIFAKRAHGKYAIDNALTEGAREVIGRAVMYCTALANGIGGDTFLGCCGTPNEWADEFRSDLDRII
tara:strand:+ start:2607 stop:2882 length:276 start_codon:yes stop_codon:yes gene_type:complete